MSHKNQKTRNGNITSFFKPVSRSQPASQAPTSSAVEQTQPSLPPSSPPSIKSSPIVVATRSETSVRKLEIGASDEDDGDDDSFSDDSLEDLSTLLGRSRPAPEPSKTRTAADPYATPRRKRTAVELHSSPLAVMPKHKFDLKALAKDALQDDATNASSLRVRSARYADNFKPGSDVGDVEPIGSALADIVNDQGGHNAQKVLRAVQRAEPGQAQLWYCFFDQNYKPPSSSAIPKRASRGPWRLMTHGDLQTRERNLVSGLPFNILQKNGGLPEELFEWILNEICVQKSLLMRQEYCNMVEECTDFVHQKMTPARLEELFLRLGADEALKDADAELDVQRPNPAPYEERDWSCLESFITLLGRLSKHLSAAAVEYATKTLLRMSLDKFLLTNNNMLIRYEDTMCSLIEAIPQPSWNSFCYEACSSLHANIKTQCIRLNAVLCLPINTPRTHELRRKLAIVFLFDDLALARHHPDDVMTVRGAIDRLKRSDFAVGPGTDFAELRASIILLDVCIDDGSFTASDDPDDETRFNQDVDELSTSLREVWRKINDSGMKLARTEAKSVIEWVQQRLNYSVRTKRKAKKSVFDLPGAKVDASLPRQQDFMSKYLKKPADAAKS